MLPSDHPSRVRPRVSAPCVRRLRVAASLLVPAVAVAQPRTAPVERDSAGIHIVENPSRRRAPVVFALGATPRLDVGGPPATPVTRDETFDDRNGYLRGVRLAGGGLAVIDRDRVHLFDARGRRVRTTGQPAGFRPGRFGMLTTICRTRGDTVLVFDSDAWQVSVLDTAGAVVRAIAVDSTRIVPFDGCLGDGTFVTRTRDTYARADSVARDAAAGDSVIDDAAAATVRMGLARVRLDGTPAPALGDVRVRRTEHLTQREITVAAGGDLLYVGDGTASEVRVLGADGRLRRIVRTDDPLVRITPEAAEAQRDGSIPRGVAPAWRAQRIASLRAEPRPATWPAYDRLYVDPTGRLWVEDYRAFAFPGAPRGWTAFDAAGRLVGRLVLPDPPPGEAVQPLGFGADDVLVARWSRTAGARLTIYPLVPAAAGPR